MFHPKEGLIMVPQFVVVAALLLSSFAFAETKTYSVFDIKKSIPLNDKQKTYRDYYVNIGSDEGVKPNSILAVYRRQAVVDYNRNILHDDLLIPVAHMKVVQVQKTMSVARVESLTKQKQIPVVEFNAVMMGDRVELVDDHTPLRKTKKTSRKVASR